jgi:hypothetical protein
MCIKVSFVSEQELIEMYVASFNLKPSLHAWFKQKVRSLFISDLVSNISNSE